MSKTCPNCGVNSPDNAKFCIECAYDLTDVPVNKVKEEEKPSQKTPASNDSENGNVALGCIIMIAIVIAIVAVGFFVFGSGGNNNDTQTNIQITFDEVYVYDFQSNNKTFYNYFVKAFFNNIPKDANTYMVKVIYCDSKGKELTSTTSRLSEFESSQNHNYAADISYYQTQNYIDVDHVSVQIIKDNKVLDEFNTTMNKNKLSSIPNSNNISK